MLDAIFLVLCLIGSLFGWGAFKAMRSKSYWDRVTMRWVPAERPASYIWEAVFMATMALLTFAIPTIYWLDELK